MEMFIFIPLRMKLVLIGVFREIIGRANYNGNNFDYTCTFNSSEEDNVISVQSNF